VAVERKLLLGCLHAEFASGSIKLTYERRNTLCCAATAQDFPTKDAAENDSAQV
jgi:hypothetical protein